MRTSPKAFRRIAATAVWIGCAWLTGCTFVKLKPDGKRVELRDKGQLAQSCQRIGEATSHTLSRVLFVRRSAEKVASELITLARNEAGKLGGDTVTATTEVVDGEQSFDVYRCSTP